MIPITHCVIAPHERRTAWRYPRLSDWIGGAGLGLLFFALALIA